VRIASRLSRLERCRSGGGCGLRCPSVRCVCEDDCYGREPEIPAPWPRCGRPPVVLAVVFDPDFFGNADGLADLRGEWSRDRLRLPG
jgi:hypothetical protein